MLVKYLSLWLHEECQSLLNELMPQLKLDKMPEDPLHVTLKYRPTEEEVNSFSSVEGKMTKIRVTGIGNDGKNAGIRIAFNKDVEPFYKGTPIPHVTISLAENALPKDTAFLQYKDIDSFEIPCTFGYFVQNEKDERVTFTL